jgi:hypothetical protein
LSVPVVSQTRLGAPGGVDDQRRRDDADHAHAVRPLTW